MDAPQGGTEQPGWLMAQTLFQSLIPNLDLFEERSKRPWSFVLLFCSGSCLLSGSFGPLGKFL